MKNRSIRFKLTLWVALVLILISGLVFFSVRYASGLVLRHTIRDYLISTVEENVEEIKYVETKGDTPTYNYLPLEKGYLEIDEDFMDVVNDVHTALYTADGELLYGENPLAIQSSELNFTSSHTWNEEIDGVRYNFYDRKLTLSGKDIPELWIRGVVPETKSVDQLAEITRIALFIFPFLMLLSLLFGYLLAGRMLSPIRDIEQTASKISAGSDLKQRIETDGNQDEIGRLANVFNAMIGRLDSSFESERQFTSDASHEMRTPLSVIKAQSEYILEKDRTAEEYREALEVVAKQSQRMDDLVTDMLDYTRMDKGIERYPFSPVDLSPLVDEISGQMALVKTNGIDLSYAVEPNIWVEGNELLLSRLLQNLISNAYRYGKENGSILLSLKKDGDSCRLSVKDDGIGIPREEQEKIFDRFYRTDSSRTVKGTGLGLSMVKRITELHGGEIVLSSTPGEGSDFTIVLPLLRGL